MSITYNSFKSTALVRGAALSVPVRTLLKRGIIKEGLSILDYGCGHGETAAQLPTMDITLFDKYNPQHFTPAALDRRYDVVMCHYVFNVIPTKEEHAATLEALRGLSDNVYISVRADTKAIGAAWDYDPINEAYYTGRSTQRLYNVGMVSRLFGDVEYITNNSSLKLFRLI